MRRILRTAVGLLALIFLASPWLAAQIESGSITGQVTDPQRAAIPDADVTVTNIETGAVTTMKTKSDGSFAFPTLRPSRYKITGVSRYMVEV